MSEAASHAWSAAALPVDSSWFAQMFDPPSCNTDGFGGKAIGPVS